LQFLDPQPDDETLASIYQREYYDAWGMERDEELTRSIKRSTFGRILPPIRTQYPETPRLLDCGAATGYLMEEAASRGMEPYGVELSEFGAARIADTFGVDHVFCGPFDQAAFAGVGTNFFDIITMIDFIEHVRSPLETLAKALTLLRPSGQIVILTPNTDSWSRRLMGLHWLHYKIEHLYYFCPRSITLALQLVGFEKPRVRQAWKSMNLHYLGHQFCQYRNPVLTPASSAAQRLSPPGLLKGMFPITFGELLVTAIKPGSCGRYN
jgi:SAM-dependent methyltransferase